MRHLEDGVYPVLPDDARPSEEIAESEIVSLLNTPLERGEQPETVRILARPLIQLRETPSFDFTFEENTCTRIGFETNEAFRAYTREHVGDQLAIVIEDRVITQHKIREPIEGKLVQITCCVEGTADHLRKYLTALKESVRIEQAPAVTK